MKVLITQIVYRPSQLQANADGLSRLPLKEDSGDVPLPGDTILRKLCPMLIQWLLLPLSGTEQIRIRSCPWSDEWSCMGGNRRPLDHMSNVSLKVQLHLWEWPAEPWARVHVDFFGPVWESNSLYS